MLFPKRCDFFEKTLTYMFLTMFFKMQNIVQTMHLTMLIAHPYKLYCSARAGRDTSICFPFFRIVPAMGSVSVDFRRGSPNIPIMTLLVIVNSHHDIGQFHENICGSSLNLSQRKINLEVFFRYSVIWRLWWQKR